MPVLMFAQHRVRANKDLGVRTFFGRQRARHVDNFHCNTTGSLIYHVFAAAASHAHDRGCRPSHLRPAKQPNTSPIGAR